MYSTRDARVNLPFYFVLSFDQITRPFFGPSYSITESQIVTPKKNKNKKIKRFLNHKKYKQKHENKFGRLDEFSFRFSASVCFSIL